MSPKCLTAPLTDFLYIYFWLWSYRNKLCDIWFSWCKNNKVPQTHHLAKVEDVTPLTVALREKQQHWCNLVYHAICQQIQTRPHTVSWIHFKAKYMEKGALRVRPETCRWRYAETKQVCKKVVLFSAAETKQNTSFLTTVCGWISSFVLRLGNTFVFVGEWHFVFWCWLHYFHPLENVYFASIGIFSFIACLLDCMD